jgi:polyisoprenyl-teichoic acid--peptidoglycan teichoic acid transferase
VTLNGEEALAYVRERMAFASGDFQRVRNQQAYVKGLAAKILDTNVIADSGALSHCLKRSALLCAR